MSTNELPPSWWRRRWWKLPVWVWLALALVASVGSIGDGDGSSLAASTSTADTASRGAAAPMPSTTEATTTSAAAPMPSTTEATTTSAAAPMPSTTEATTTSAAAPMPSTTEATTTTAAARVPWEGPPDGSWDWGDVSFGASTLVRAGFEHSFTLSTPPTLRTVDGGQTVTMTSVAQVERIYNYGSAGGISDNEYVFFIPGNLSYLRHHENYGTDPRFTCEDERIRVGQPRPVRSHSRHQATRSKTHTG